MDKTKRNKPAEPERRSFTVKELRVQDNGDKPAKITGYAAVFNSLSEPLSDWWAGTFREMIRPGAFKNAIERDDVRALWNHDPNYVLGRNKSGTLSLSEDDVGLKIEITPPDAQWARDLMESMRRGDVDQMSFGFRVVTDAWRMQDGEDIRELLDVELFDVSVVTYPAYTETSAAVRSKRNYQPVPVAKSNGNTVEYTLDLTRCSHEIKPGVVVEDAACYNGTVPGPTIRATEGDTVRITLRNQLEESTTIHWHGLRIPVTMDGVPPFSQTEVEAGGEFVYEWVAPKAGTYMYHPHGAMHLEQIDKGAYGFVIIDPAAAQEQYDREYTLMLSSWTVEGAEGMEDMGYNTYTINGKTYPAVVLDVAEGEHVRMRFGNLSAALAHPIHIHGHDFRLIAKDGSPLPAPWTVNTINVAPGETYDLDFVADNPGIWVGHCHNLHHLPDMMFIIRYDGFDIPEIDPSGMAGMGVNSKDKKKKKPMAGMQMNSLRRKKLELIEKTL